MLSSKTGTKQSQKRRANPRKSKPSPSTKRPEAPSTTTQAFAGPQSHSRAINELLANPVLAKAATAIRNGNGTGFSALVRNKANRVAESLTELPVNTLADLAIDIVRYNCPPSVLMWFLGETRLDPIRTLSFFTSHDDDHSPLTANQRQMLALVLNSLVSTSRVPKQDGDDDDGEAKRANLFLLQAFCKALLRKNHAVVKAYHEHVPTPTICSLTYRSTAINSMIHSPPAMSLKDVNGKLLELILIRILPLINNRPRSDLFYSPLLGPFHAPRSRKGAADASFSQAHLCNVRDCRIMARIVSFLDVYSATELRKSCRGLYKKVGIVMEDRFPRQLAFMYSNFVTRQEFAVAANGLIHPFENKVERFVRLATHPKVLDSAELHGWMIHCALVRCAWDTAEQLLRAPKVTPMDAPTLYLLLDGLLSTIEGGSKLFNRAPFNSQQTTYPIHSGRLVPTLTGILPSLDLPLTESELSDLESLLAHDQLIHVPASALGVLSQLLTQLGTRCWLLLDAPYFVSMVAALKCLPMIASSLPTLPLDAQAVFRVLVPMANGDQAQAIAALTSDLEVPRALLTSTADDEEGTLRNLLHAAIKLGQVDVARALIDGFDLLPTAEGVDEGQCDGGQGPTCMRKMMWFAGHDPEYMCRLAAASGECTMHDLISEWIHGAHVAQEEEATIKYSVLDQHAPHRKCLVTAKRVGHDRMVRHILDKHRFDMAQEYTRALMKPLPEHVLKVTQELQRGHVLSRRTSGDGIVGRRCVELIQALVREVDDEQLLTQRLVQHMEQ